MTRKQKEKQIQMIYEKETMEEHSNKTRKWNTNNNQKQIK